MSETDVQIAQREILMNFQHAAHAALIAAVLASAAVEDHGGNNQNASAGEDANRFQSSVIGSSPSSTVGGIVSGGAPWVVREGSASIHEGTLQAEVSGLLLGAGAPSNLVGTVGPVQMVAASVVCGGSGGTVVATTNPVPLSSIGDAHIEASVLLPSPCIAPVVLVRISNPGTQPGAFIALTGLSSTSAQANDNDNQDHDKSSKNGGR
jgi:hypothetical protein